VPVPEDGSTVYLVLDDFEQLGRAYRDADEKTSDARSLTASIRRAGFPPAPA